MIKTVYCVASNENYPEFWYDTIAECRRNNPEEQIYTLQVSIKITNKNS